MEGVDEINQGMGGNKNDKGFLNTGKGSKDSLHSLSDPDDRLPARPLGESGFTGHGYCSWDSAFAYRSYLDICSLAASPSIRC
jgi:hypothetical protein